MLRAFRRSVAPMRAGQHEGCGAVEVARAESLGDHAAHRMTDDMCPFDLELIEQMHRLRRVGIGIGRDRIGFAVARRIPGDDAIEIRQRLELLRPASRIAVHSVQQKQRRSVACLAVADGAARRLNHLPLGKRLFENAHRDLIHVIPQN